MADKENQWEDSDISYTESDDDYSQDDELNQNPEDSDGEESEYSDDEYEEDYDDAYSNSQTKKQNLMPIIMIILFIILAGIVGFVLLSGRGNNSVQQNNQIAQSQDINNPNDMNNTMPSDEMNSQPQANDAGEEFFNENSNSDSTGMMNINFNEGGETEVISNNASGEPVSATVVDNNNADLSVPQNTNASENAQPNPSDNNGVTEDLFAQDNNTAIVVDYSKQRRTNPFKPPVVKKEDNVDIIEGFDLELIEPPKTVVTDENLSRLLQTQISGILYDSKSPSAIVNINGVDQFVKVGDTISGYKIKSITQNQVQIDYKNNSYVASVGELFSKGALEKVQAVDNLENKFAGRYKNN